MNSTTPIAMPVLTGLDAAMQLLAAVFYIAIGVAALTRAPRDIRTRVFFLFSLANLAAFAVPAFLWWRGMTDPLATPRIATALVLAGLSEGALLLFHFTQVFPWRRPWIRSSGIQMSVAYVLVPSVIAALFLFLPKTPAEIQPSYMLAFLVFGFPLLVLLAIILPVTAIVSLVRSYAETARPELHAARVPLIMILIGQIAGGALALVFIPALAVLVPNSAALTMITVIAWALGLLTPAAFALAVWKYNVLAISAD